MSTITFYDLLGVSDDAVPRDAAAAKWPSHAVQGGTGVRDQPDIAETRLLMDFFQSALTFRNVRPGADPDRVGLTAEMLVGLVPPPMPLVLAALPDVEFHLLPTSSNPARITATLGDLGLEFLIESLPVEIHVPLGFIRPLEPAGSTSIPATETQIDSFVSGQHDTLRVVLNSNDPSSISVHVKVRMTEEGRFVVEPAVPLSVGPCRFLGLPCRAIHDLNLFPSPLLGVGPGDERHFGDQALEWTRHPLLEEGESEFGVVTVRTVDLDDTRAPLSDLRDEVNPQNTAERRFEWVIEDLAFPIGTDPVPVPSHFMIGLRRQLGPGDDPAGAYNLGGLAIPLKGIARILRFNYLVIEQLLLRSVPSPDIAATDGDRQFAFLKLALVDDPTGKGNGATIDLTDEWTVLVGWRHQPGIQLFQLFGASFLLLGVRVGLSIQRISKGAGVFDSGVLVGDLEITLGKKDQPAQPSPGICKLEGESDEPKGVVIHDLGLRFGSVSVGSFWQTGGAKLKAFDIIRLEIEEFGLVTEPSGAVYFGFSGSIPLPCGADAGKPVSSAESAGSAGKVENGVGFRFIRLRGKVAGAEEAPFLLIDGIGLSIRYGKLGITGVGMIAEYVLDGHRYKESGVSVEVRFPAAGQEIILGGMFFHGTVRGPVNNFTYWMVGLHVSPIPIGPITLTDVRLLFAWNMTPNLGPADAGSATAMRLFEWYKSNRDAVALPSNRNMGAGGWRPEVESYTIGVGAKVGIGSRAVTIDVFFVYLSTASGKGLLAGLEIYLLASKKPIGFAVLEIDGDRWSLMAGLSVGTSNVIGKPIPFLSDAPFLTGTFYHTNKPATTAIGQFLDPSTWLAVHIGGGFGKKFDLFTLELFAGMCLQIVDLPEGPRVFALRVSFTGGSRLFKVGGIDFYLTLELMAGVWRTESKVSGFIVYFEGGLNIDVFWVFSWGASVRVECDYLGPAPAYRRLMCEVKIHTPWWLPDVTFRWTRKLGSPAVEQMSVVATPVIEGAAKQLSVAEPVPLGAIAPVVGTTIDPAAVYSINELASAGGIIPPEVIAGIVPISVDSSVSLHFKASVDDRLVFGQNTVPGLSADASSEMSTRYELVELGIRRRPRVDAVNWTTLINPAESRMESLTGLPPNVVQQRMRQKVRMRWDADFQREGKPDARRLLINTDAPYWFAVLNLEGDESLVQNVPGWPCCGPRDKPQWHTLDFNAVTAGTRVPAVQYFTESRSTLRWTGINPPIAGPGQAAGGFPSVARLNADVTPEAVFARLAFPEIAHTVELFVRWKPFHLDRLLVIRAFRGLKLLEEQTFPLSQVPPNSVFTTSSDGISEITLSLRGAPVNDPAVDFGYIEWIQLRFRSVTEEQEDFLTDGRCQASTDSSAKPGGRFAWLPDHEYEVSFKTRVTVRHEGTGELVREVPQTLLFHTKGLPGLNQSDRVGQEFEPYVESAYPGPGRPVYRGEPVALALNERSDIFRLPDAPSPDDPLERQQQVDWVLVVSRVGGAGPAERISRPDSDWIVAHRGTVPPPKPGRRPVDVVLVAEVAMRKAASLDPLWQRFEAVLASPSSCNQPPSTAPSRVLIHRPYDPAQPGATPAFWPPRAVLRAGAQIRSGPYVERSPFQAGDETALLSTAGAWKVQDDAIGPEADTAGITSLAIFGDASWRHCRITALVHPQSGAAGVAAAVTASTAVLFLVDASTNRLLILRRQGSTDTELTGAALPAGLQAPYVLEVTAYDDAWQASVGDTQVKAPRDFQDSGRLALGVRGTGRIHELRVDPLDVYRFEFLTSRYIDFADHIASWSGKIAALPEVAPATSTIAELLTATPITELMTAGSDPQRRQRAFDQWTSTLGVPLRRQVNSLELSIRSKELLLIESPEPLPFSEDVSLSMVRNETGGTQTPVPLIILSDGAESRAYLVPLAANGDPAELSAGEYEITWSVARNRYRAATPDPDSRFNQQATMALRVE
jgi:hypothetical protein